MTPLAAGRLPLEWVAWPAAAITGAAVAVLLAGVLAAARARGTAGAVFARHAAFTLELLLAAGLLRLSALGTWRALGTVAAVIAVRQVVSRGVRLGARASGGG